MRRLRICQLITTLGIGGAERGLLDLATRMDRDRFEVEVFALRDGAIRHDLADAGIAVTILGVRGKWDLMKLPRADAACSATDTSTCCTRTCSTPTSPADPPPRPPASLTWCTRYGRPRDDSARGSSPTPAC